MMRKTGWTALGLWITLGWTVSAQQMDGRKFHELTMEFETPHLEWAKPLSQGKLKALFVTSLCNARHVVETAQRMDLDFEVVTTAIRFRSLGITGDNDGYYGRVYTGTSQTAKGEELLQKLEKQYDVIIVVFNDLDQFPARAKLKMLSQVKAGAGLVLYGVTGQEKLKSIFSAPDTQAAQDIVAGVPADTAGLAGLQTYTFGQGRIARAHRMIAAPYGYHSPRWWAEYENAQVLTLRTLLWAAGRRPSVTVTAPVLSAAAPIPAATRDAALDVKAPGAGTLRLRLRDANHRVLQTGDAAFQGAQSIAYTLPALGTGRYYLDVMALDGKGVDNLGVFAFDVDAGVTAECVADDDAIREFEPIRATLKLNKALPGGRAIVSLIDSPYERVWFQREIPLGDADQVPIEVADYYMPTLAAFLRAEVYEGQTPLASADKPFFFPVHNRRRPTYSEFAWEYNPGASDRLRSMAENDAMGWCGVYCRIDGDRPSVQHYMLLNQRLGSNGGAGLGLEKAKDSGGFLYPAGPIRHASDEENAVVARLQGRYSLGHPDAEEADRVLTRSAIRNKSLDRYPLSFYQLGNEINVSYDGGFAPDDGRAFVDMLKESYGTIAKLNAEWGRDYASFEAVPNMPMTEAKQKGLYPEYMAHRRLVDRMIFHRFRAIADEIKKVDSGAPVGCDGTWSLSNSGFNMEDILGEAGAGYWAHYSRLPRAEVLRSLRPDLFHGCIWGWTMSNEALPEAPWFNLVAGTAKHIDWFISGCTVGSQQLAADYRPFRPRMAEELEKLRTGVAQLLITTPLRPDGLAIWENYNSGVAGLLGDPRLVSVNDTTMPLIAFCYQNGINFDFVARRQMAEKLSHYKALFLAGASSMSEYEAQQMLEFVKNGGILIADINPGIMNDSFRFLENNRLAELFGKLDSAATPAPYAVNVAAELNGKVIRFACEGVNGSPGVAPFTVRAHGKGQAILLNFTLASARDRANPADYDRFLGEVLAACGMASPVELAGAPAESVVRVRQGKGFQLVGLTHRRLAASGTDGGSIELKFPEAGYIYEVGRGLAAKDRQIRFDFAPPFRVFSFFAAEQAAPALNLSARVAEPGRPLQLDVSGFAPGRVLCLQVRDAQGRLINPRSEAVSREVFEVDPAQPKRPVHFAYNTPKGSYQLTLTDVVTGLSSEAKVEVR